MGRTKKESKKKKKTEVKLLYAALPLVKMERQEAAKGAVEVGRREEWVYHFY